MNVHRMDNKWLLTILLDGISKYMVIFANIFPFFLYTVLVNYWHNTQTQKTQQKLLQLLQQASQYLAFLPGQELLALCWVHLLWTEVGSLIMEELRRKITMAFSLGVLYVNICCVHH